MSDWSTEKKNEFSSRHNTSRWIWKNFKEWYLHDEVAEETCSLPLYRLGEHTRSNSKKMFVFCVTFLEMSFFHNSRRTLLSAHLYLVKSSYFISNVVPLSLTFTTTPSIRCLSHRKNCLFSTALKDFDTKPILWNSSYSETAALCLVSFYNLCFRSQHKK